MKKRQTVFIEPGDPNIRLWKYLDFAKFISLIDSGGLYFSRADKLLDPYEGSYPLFDHHKARQEVFLNCWHESGYESAAMWELYAQKNEGLAIVSTFTKLKQSFGRNKDFDIYFGKVNYIDYSKIKEPSQDMVQPFAYKRKSFEHEKEVRAVIHCADKLKCRNKGLFVPIDIAFILDHVYVAPYAEDWIVNLTNSLLKRYGLAIPVTRSRLYDSGQVLGV